MSDVRAYCSWCYKKTKHQLEEESLISRDIYQCCSCKNYTLKCRYCSEMARGKPSDDTTDETHSSGISKFMQFWNHELCSEHDGSVASFSKLTMKLDDITDYEKIFKREKYNLAKAGKFAGLGLVGAIAVSTRLRPAPIAAAMGRMGLLGTASTGTAIASLHGAALTSASLVAIGGSVATGTAIISASGVALGGAMGGVIANKYFSDDKSFAISELRDGKGSSKTIFINGFTQEKETNFYDWQCSQLAFDPTHTMYSLNWSSQTNLKLGMAFSKGVGSQAVEKILKEIAKKGGKEAAKKLIGYPALVANLAGNPWHVSMIRAAQAGVQLAEAISRTSGQRFNLVGHSLGCRVIYYALEALASKDKIYINDVILLGGAVGRNDREGWGKAVSAISGSLYNCHSNQDKVLSVMYKTANLGLSDPIGINPINIRLSKIKNINCDDLVDSHMSWKVHYESILNKIYS